MKILIAALIAITPLLLAGCTTRTVAVDTVVYDPGYSNHYVYSVGYYNNRPYYWGTNYYTGYGWGDNAYWGGGYYNGF